MREVNNLAGRVRGVAGASARRATRALSRAAPPAPHRQPPARPRPHPTLPFRAPYVLEAKNILIVGMCQRRSKESGSPLTRRAETRASRTCPAAAAP